MGLPARSAALLMSVVAVLWAGNPPADTEPRYDSATVVNIRMVVAEVREVPKGSPLAGIHLLARPESARVDSEPWDVYIGPVDFLRELDLAFHPRDKVDVAGSKSKVGSTTVILTKEIRQNGSTLYIRDEKGEPLWKTPLKGA
jgi:hypothetical protein